MNVELMVYNINKELERRGISADLVDTKSLVDSNITYPENLKLILDYLGEQKAKFGKKELIGLANEGTEALRNEQVKYSISLSELFAKYRVIGLVGDRNTGKTSLALSKLIELNEKLKADKKEIPIYVFGAEQSIRSYLKSRGIKILYNKEDIHRLTLRNSIILIDEVANVWSSENRDKECDKIKRFFTRLIHSNCWVLMGTAQTGWFNKFSTSLIDAYLVKSISYTNLVNGTILKKLITGIESDNDYVLELNPNEYFILTTNGLTTKQTFEYDKNLDSKSENENPFVEKKEIEKEINKENTKRGELNENKNNTLLRNLSPRI